METNKAWHEDYWQAARRLLAFRAKHGLPKSFVSPLIGLNIREVEAIEDFRFAQIAKSTASRILHSLPGLEALLLASPQLKENVATMMDTAGLEMKKRSVADFIREHGASGAARSFLLRKLRRINRTDLDSILEELIAEGVVSQRKIVRENGGRPPCTYFWVGL